MQNSVVQAANRFTARHLDRLEQAILLFAYIFTVQRLWPADFSATDFYLFLLLFSEGVLVLLIMIRSPTDRISVRWSDWAIGMAGSFLALAVSKGGHAIAPTAGTLLMITGVCIHVGAKLSLWRSFGVVAADRGIRTRGLYRFIRHPMYAGYIVSHAGFLLLAPSWWNLGVYLCCWALLVARIFAEERVLSNDPVYVELKKRVRYRLIPGIF